MDKAKILRLCADIEKSLPNLCLTIFYREHDELIEKLKAIAAEITAPPKSNADRIRQMSDEELFDFLDAITDTCGYLPPQCDNCQMKYKDTSPKCDIQAWLKQEVIEGDTD